MFVNNKSGDFRNMALTWAQFSIYHRSNHFPAGASRAPGKASRDSHSAWDNGLSFIAHHFDTKYLPCSSIIHTCSLLYTHKGERYRCWSVLRKPALHKLRISPEPYLSSKILKIQQHQSKGKRLAPARSNNHRIHTESEFLFFALQR